MDSVVPPLQKRSSFGGTGKPRNDIIRDLRIHITVIHRLDGGIQVLRSLNVGPNRRYSKRSMDAKNRRKIKMDSRFRGNDVNNAALLF